MDEELKEIKLELEQEELESAFEVDGDPLDTNYKDAVDLELENQNKKNNDKGLMGGKRKGAGRPKGARDIAVIKQKIREYTSNKELRAMIERLKRWAKRDPKIAMWYAEQVFGKARQTTGLDGGSDNKPIMISKILDELEKK